MLAAMNTAKDEIAYDILTGKVKIAGQAFHSDWAGLTEAEKAAAALAWAKEWKKKTTARWAGAQKPWPVTAERLIALPD